ncbi:hypothetical protein KTD31_02380 [Burkholderia multivorans]|uniref:hypothetical protein n=1 Tax=Burkholderia multivorans TaxID=87883 RepID=UPI001C215E4D|nr:hypothetical protein [Burkholderia multivorans]MBU9200252.1 hypothetical protein [Burkholderia multivorans]MDN8078621.1 hypothetical protein [Burkholderia multivorans]
MKQKRIHLASDTGGRSRCRYTSRPSVRATFVPLSAFLALPVSLRCSECNLKVRAAKQPVRVFNLEPGQTVTCYHCEQNSPGRSPLYGFGEAFLAGADHSPYDGNANFVCRAHVDKDAELPDPTA